MRHDGQLVFVYCATFLVMWLISYLRVMCFGFCLLKELLFTFYEKSDHGHILSDLCAFLKNEGITFKSTALKNILLICILEYNL